MRRVLVTGGGSGIGLAVAEKFAEAGDAVRIVGRDEERLKLAAAGLRASWPGSKVDPEPCDVSSADQVAELVERLRRAKALPDVLVNNAGLFHAAPVLKADEAQAEQQWQVNVMGPWRLLQAFAATAIAEGRPLTVANVLSVTALQAYKGCAFYGATKAALKSLMETARAELRGKDVRIVNLFPGATETPIWGGREMDYSKMMDPVDVAAQLFVCCAATPRTLVEDLVLRPAGGDF